MKLFLLVYDRRAGLLVSVDAYDEAEHALALQRRAELEIENREKDEIEVVVLSAASLEALRKTHSRYFESLKAKISDVAAAR